MLGAVRAEALRQFSLCCNEQSLVRELGRLRAQRLEHLDLRGAVRDMVLAAHHMCDAEIDIVDDARQEVEPAAVLAPDHWIAQQLRVEPLLPSDEIVPYDWRVMVEAEAPVRRAALRHGRLGRLALIDGRQSAPEQHLAAKV